MFGLVIGSFLNVVVHRLPIMLERAWRAEISDTTDEPLEDDGLPARYNLWVPRSACPHCGHVLSAWENLPVLSYRAAARPLLRMQGAREPALSAARNRQRRVRGRRTRAVRPDRSRRSPPSDYAPRCSR